MRVAFLLDLFPRLSNTFVLNQITGMIERGHDVDIYARGLADLGAVHEDVRRYRLLERLRHLPIPRSPARRAAVAARELLRPSSWHPVVLDALDARRHGHAARSLAQLYTALSFLRAEPYDVLHAQFGDLGPAALPLVARAGRAERLVVSFRGADLTRLPRERPGLYDELYRRGDLFLPVCRAFAERLVAAGCPPERVRVHHSGIRTERFAFRARGRPEGAPTELVFVGRLVAKKGVDDAIRAVAAARRQGRDVRLTVIGDGELRGELEHLGAELGLGAALRLTGRLPQSEVIAALDRAHVLVAPSRTAPSGDQEGIPNVLKEAMALGLPVLSTRHSGIPELVEDGVSGLLADEGDVAGLTDGLLRLAAHPERWEAMGRAGRRRVEEAFDQGRLDDELVERYREVLSLPSRSRSDAPRRRRSGSSPRSSAR